MKPTTAIHIVVSSVLIACSSGDVRLLEDGIRSSERIRRMDMTLEPALVPDGFGEPAQHTLSAVAVAVRAHCEHIVNQGLAMGGCFGDVSGQTACDARICAAQRELCVMDTFASIAEPGQVILTDVDGNNTFRVPDQDVESVAGAWQASQASAAGAFSWVALALGASGGCSAAELAGHQSDGGDVLEQTNDELLAATLVEALAAGERAADEGARTVLGIADRDRTGYGDLGQAARLSWFDENLSRLVAVQTHTGGLDLAAVPGSSVLFTAGDYFEDENPEYFHGVYISPDPPTTPGAPVEGIGAQLPCRGQCEAALRILRQSGAPFSKIIDDEVSLLALVQLEVGPRLDAIYGEGVFDSTSDTSLAEQWDLNTTHFAEARSWMRHVGTVFARPTGRWTSPPPRLHTTDDGTEYVPSPALEFDATTMSQPVEPPAMHYVTAAQGGGLWTVHLPVGTSGGPDNPSLALPPLRPERSYLFDFAHSLARESLVTRAADLSPAGLGLLRTVIHAAASRRALQTEVCVNPDTSKPNTLRIRAFGLEEPPASGTLQLVVGTNALRCAVQGHIEGQRCSSVGGTDPDGPWVLTTGRASRVRAAEWIVSASAASPPRDYLYIVRLRSDRTTAGPGAYEAVAGIPLPVGSSTPGECVTIPYDFESFQHASDAFSMEEDLTPVRECGDIDLNAPLPLEDEIISDGDPYEDSWEHHLRAAETAAEHSDRLGQVLIDSGLALDQRSDAAAAAIEEACGVPFNVGLALDAESGAVGSFVHPTATCSEAADMTATCPASYTCVGVSCVLDEIFPDPSEFPYQREQLEECLGLGGSDTTVPVVALGTTSLCYWYTNGDRDDICNGATRGECPYLVPEGGDCASVDPDDYDPGTETLAMLTDVAGQTLNLLPSTDPPADRRTAGPTGPIVPEDEQLCNYIRGARVASTFGDAYELLSNIQSDGFFAFENVEYWADRIGWSGYPYDYSEILLDGAPWTDRLGNQVGWTGYPFDDRTPSPPLVSTRWPCAGYPGAFSLSENALFWPGDCGDQTSRALLNRRIGRAVATLGALSGRGLSQLRMPADYNDVATIQLSEMSPHELHDGGGATWWIVGTADFGDDTLSGIIGSPRTDPGIPLWSGEGWTSVYGATGVNTSSPIAFLNFGVRYTGDNEGRPQSIARRLWEGLDGPGFVGNNDDQNYRFYENIHRYDDENRRMRDLGWNRRNLFLRAIVNYDHEEDRVYIENGRGPSGGTTFGQLSNLFGIGPTDLGGNTGRNDIHLFVARSGDTGYGAAITRRDLLDAMELMCEVARTVSPTDVAPTPDPPPPMWSMADIASVQRYAENVADAYYTMSQRQYVQGVPAAVVAQIRGESTSQNPDAGTRGRLVSELLIELRRLQASPRAIAAAMTSISTELGVMRREEANFDRQNTIRFLQLALTIFQELVACASAGVAAGYACGIASASMITSGLITSLEHQSAVADFRNTFDLFKERILGLFDTIATQSTELQNAVERVRSILGQLRASQMGARSALSGALLATSDAMGRQYSVNTLMRRSYDINRQRYRDAQRAAVRAAAVARMAIEQRFGVDLDEQMCASLVDRPSLWAGDVCNASGVNYADLRNPDVEVGEDAIRRMFIGDYVRRLRQYVESYRFDYPYSSGDDLMVMSLRDDVVRATERCERESRNLLGESNNLAAGVLPAVGGGVDDPPARGWGTPSGGCTPGAANCVRVSYAPPPLVDSAVDDPSPVPSAVEGSPVRAFEVAFAPGLGEGYTDGAAIEQEVVLSGGFYSLSWYEQRDPMSLPEPSVDARTDVANASGLTVTDLVPARALTSNWVRRWLMLSVPTSADGTVYHLGVFPDPMVSSGVHTQTIRVAGLELNDISDLAHLLYDPEIHGPGTFTPTTAAGHARYDNCPTDDPAAFRDRFVPHCTMLCSGGFGSGRCLPDEEPQEYCYWEVRFQVTEDNLLGRDGGFGGGFAFGNYNYRSGEVAVNVVGTGVRNCDAASPDACYGTAGLPFSLSHTPLGVLGDSAAYTVRAHDGTLHPVHLHDGWVESGRALAAERYLTNPLSSADASLLADYTREEFRGRPMTGSYRFILWDTPSTAFHNIEDIQILWRYRYFTRTGEALSCPGG